LVTQDKDFLVEASWRQEIGESFLGIIYAPQLGLSLGRSIEELELLAQLTDPEEWTNRVEYLPLK